jgi:hypothetical protein
MSKMEGFVDRVEPETPVRGWARWIDRDQAAPLVITLLLNDQIVGRGQPEIFREDLDQECGFEIDTDVPVTLAMFLSGEAVAQASSGDDTFTLPVWLPPTADAGQ